MRKEFDVTITFNGKRRRPLVIDSHFRKKHPDVTYEIIIALVKSVDGSIYEPQEVVDGWSYYAINGVSHKNAPYRLVLVTRQGESFLGVINAFRINRKKP